MNIDNLTDIQLSVKKSKEFICSRYYINPLLKLVEKKHEYLLQENTYNKYWLIQLQNDQFIYTNGCSEEEAKNSIETSIKYLYEDIINCFELPFKTDIGNTGLSGQVIKTGKTILLNLYSKTEFGYKLHKTIEHELLLGETEEIIYHKYSSIYSDYSIIAVAKRKEEIKKDMDKSKKLNLVKILKAKTSGKMMDCNNAILSVYNQNPSLDDNEILRQAVIIMNSKKQVIAAQKTNNDTKYFVIKYEVSPFGAEGVIIKFGCESEQGVKKLKETFSKELEKITNIAVSNGIYYIASLLPVDYDSTSNINMKLQEISGTLGENVKIVALENVESIADVPNTFTDIYIHGSTTTDKAAGLLIYNSEKKTNKDVIRKIVHQLTYTNPLALRESDLCPSIIEDYRKTIEKQITKENALFAELTLMNSNGSISKEQKELLKKLKNIPEKALDKVIQGKLNKFKKEVCFELQEWQFPEDIIDKNGNKKKPKAITIKQLLKSMDVTLFDFVVI